MSKYKVIFTTERGHRHQQAALAGAPEVLDVVLLRKPEREDLQTHLATADYLISERSGIVDEKMIASAPNLKMILRLGSMTFDIDLEAARAAGVIVCYWPVSTVIRVAEHVVMQMLALSKKVRETEAIALAAGTGWGTSKRTDEDTFAYNWSDRQSVEGVWQRTIGILGFGEIGTELARRLGGWGCNLIYNKRQQLPARVETELGLTYVDQATLFSGSDYVANLLPFYPSTDMVINAAILATMKDGACIVSCGSGSVIDE
ncbi:MAG TPA: NAD(P)-dependent oxidoreductase, partial [candidate division Zixibacteria bacterium]|nr:NAD(P)-dependent oxidoreductase [candidate division Zixibacteria bacterium]